MAPDLGSAQAWTPPIWTRDHRLAEGIVAFDPRPLSPAAVPVIEAALGGYRGG
ncbi:MAG TPA: hypothetical protein VEZ44_11115 [bacterium]|nr:hypothetical protein [bacterium]